MSEPRSRFGINCEKIPTSAKQKRGYLTIISEQILKLMSLIANVKGGLSLRIINRTIYPILIALLIGLAAVVYAQDAPILGQIYQYISRDWRSESLDLRGYNTPIAVRNLANDVPDEVVET